MLRINLLLKTGVIDISVVSQKKASQVQAEFFRTRILLIGSTTGSPKNYQEKDKRNRINMIFNVLLLGKNLHSCNFSGFILFIAGIELAVVSFLLEQLGVVVLAVQFSLMGNVI